MRRSALRRRVVRCAINVSKQRLLAVQPVFGLIEDHRRRRLEHVGRDFLVAMRGQAVHERRADRARAASSACVT